MKLQENKSALYDFHWGKGDNMAEMSFAMKYSTLERFSNEIALMSEDFSTICDELRALVSSVDGEWKGKAHDRFEERYKKLDPKLKTIAEALSAYSSAIAENVSNEEEIEKVSAGFFVAVSTYMGSQPGYSSGNSESYASVRDTLDSIASSEINNNGEKYCRWFTDHYPGLTYEDIKNKGYGWCDRFTSWVLGQMGIKLSAGGCDGQKNAFGSDYHSAVSGYTPKIGDLVFLDYNHDGSFDHVAIYYEKDGYPCLLHGNWGGAVKVSKLDSDTGMGCKISEAIAGYGDVASYATTHPLN